MTDLFPMYLTASEMGRLSSLAFFALGAAAYINEDMPARVTVGYMTMTLILFLISADPYITWIIDQSEARYVGFGLAVVAGVISWAWAYRVSRSCIDHSPTNPDSDEDSDE